MIDPASRYKHVGTSRYITRDGAQITYRNRRFSPQGTSMPLYATVTVGANDRLDLIAARSLNNPLAFWQVADANNAMNPFALTEAVGRQLRIPVPQPR